MFASGQQKAGRIYRLLIARPHANPRRNNQLALKQ